MSLAGLIANALVVASLATGAPGIAPGNLSTFPVDQWVASQDDAISRLVLDAERKVAVGDFEGAKQALEAVAAMPDFDAWDPAFRYQILSILVDQYIHLSEFDKAYQVLIKAGELPFAENDHFYWFKLSLTSLIEEEDQAISALMRYLNIRSDETLLRDDLLDLYLSVALDHPDGELRHKQLLEALYASGYVSDDASRSSKAIWFELFKDYVEGGDFLSAWSLMPFDHPQAILTMRIDGRYKAFRNALPNADYVYALEQDTIRKQKAFADQPDNFNYLMALMGRLTGLGRLDEAIKMATSAIDRAMVAPSADAWQMAWLYASRAGAYNLSGQLDEAERDYQRAIDISPEDSLNVFKINLASFYNEQGMGDKAMHIISGLNVSELGDYERLWVATIVACVYGPLSAEPIYTEALDTLKSKASIDYNLAGYGLLCIDAEDDFARLLIEGLENKGTRGAVLLSAQDYMLPPYNSEQNLRVIESSRRVLARPDVQAAIAHYGVVEYQPVYWTDYY